MKINTSQDATNLLNILKARELCIWLFCGLLCLQASERKAYNPKTFCRTYTMDKQPLNTGEQKDMTEFFTDLIGKIEEMSPVLVRELCFVKPYGNGRNIVGQQLPALLDVTCCVLLHTVANCCVLSRRTWKWSSFWDNTSEHFLSSVIV